MIWSLSLTLEDTADSVAKTIAAQRRPLDSLSKVVLNNRIILDSLLAEQGGVCAVTNTTCCTWISPCGEVEIPLHKIIEQATWSKKLAPSSRSFLIWIGLS